MRLFSVLLCALLGFSSIWAQTPATSAADIQQALLQKQAMREQSLVKNLAWRNVGPTIMSGRVVDLAVNPEDPTEFYVGYASVGVW